MPLIILGLLFLIGLLAYSIFRYMNSSEEDTRTVRERYPKAFRAFSGNENDTAHVEESENDDGPIEAEGYVDVDSFMGDIDHIVRNIKEVVSEKAKERGIDLSKWGRDRDEDDSADEDTGEDEDATIIFPTDNVEAEKNKRNIH